jgi:hypothetical protein
VIVIYKCTCMTEEATIAVPERREDEDVGVWVQSVVGSALLLHHRENSPNCRSQVTEYVKIPIDNGPDARIGKYTPQ